MTDKRTPAPGDFGVLNGFGFEVVTITKVTAQCFWYTGHRHRAGETRAYLEKLLCSTSRRPMAELASKRFVSAEAERDQRIRAARIAFEERKAVIATSTERNP